MYEDVFNGLVVIWNEFILYALLKIKDTGIGWLVV